MNLQALYDVKTRLESAAISGTGLLGEDFRLQRAVEGLKPLAAASPVFGKISAGLEQLLSAPAEQRPRQLLDVLALVDAVAYTQAKTGMEGELEPLPTGGGTYQQISSGQLRPLLTALTSSGGGRVEVVQAAWENHPEYFSDFRVLPAVIAGLGDGYSEMAELNATILTRMGRTVLPLLMEGFDPAGKKEMARRVEVISGIEGANATPWLLEILPRAKKEVRPAVITALGEDEANTELLLNLGRTERGKSHTAALQALSGRSGEAVRAFWEEELPKSWENITFLRFSKEDWASDLTAAGLRERLERAIEAKGLFSKEFYTELKHWYLSTVGKSSPAMLDFWRWAAEHFSEIERLKNPSGMHFRPGDELADCLLNSVCQSESLPLYELARKLWEQDKSNHRFLAHALAASVLTRPAEEVYETFSPYVVTKEPVVHVTEKRARNNAALKGIFRFSWSKKDAHYVVGAFGHGRVIEQTIDPRWIPRLMDAVWTDSFSGAYSPFGNGIVVGFDIFLINLVDRSNPDSCAQMLPFLRRRLVETSDWHTYSNFLFQFGGSPKGILGGALSKSKRSVNYLYRLWEMLRAASKALPVEEVIALIEEILATNLTWLRKEDIELGSAALPRTLELLRGGMPFPDWNVWWSMRD